jgi:hypothetical protein
MSENSRRCSALKANGGRCERIISASSRFCFAHDPAHQERRQASLEKANKAREVRQRNRVDEIVLLRERVMDFVEDVIKKRMNPGIASAVNQFLVTWLRLVDAENSQLELDEYTEKLLAVERHLDDKKRSTS